MLRMVGEEFRIARHSLGLSQRHVATAARISRPVYGRIERGTLQHLPLRLASQIASVLGLHLAARAYPGGNPTRDAAHGQRLRRLLSHVGPPLTHRIEVPLPATTDHPERRSWDAVLVGYGRRTAVELETRLYDVQGQLRRLHLKERDDPPDQLLLVVANTRANRRALSEFAGLFVDLPRLGTANTLKGLSAGRHPPTGLMLL
jgi:transcriptional regulator with XRE-family HTH domain